MTEDLKILFKKKKRLIAKVRFIPELWVTLLYLSNRQHMNMIDDTKEPDFSGSLRAAEIYDNDAYWQEIVKQVTGWNMTYKTLQILTDVELPETIDLDKEIRLTENNLLECFYEIKGFAAFVVNTITDRIKFAEDKLEAEKKTSDSLPSNASE